MKKTLIGIALLIVVSFAWAQDQNQNQDQTQNNSTVHEELIVSATKAETNAAEVPGSTFILSGDELRKTGAKTIADALQDVVGLDTGNGSDNGPFLANIGVWGLKEFDALLVTVDGMPVGGPFNPSLSQIPIDNIERIEIVKGPQGTLYGVSAFAGMIQIFTKKDFEGGSISAGGGSFSDKHINGSYAKNVAPDTKLSFFAKAADQDGWQDRTGFTEDRLQVNLSHDMNEGKVGLTFFTSRFNQDWGSPLPIDEGGDGKVVPGFKLDRNYAIGGAHDHHRLFGLSSDFNRTISKNLTFQNTFGFTTDQQDSLKSFVTESNVDENLGTSEGIQLRPKENTVYDDARIGTSFDAGGLHHLVAGGAVTWGHTTAAGIGFDFDYTLLPAPVVPDFSEVEPGDHRSFDDRRTFVGFYAHDEWAPHPRVTIAGGGRLDHTSETLSANFQEVGADQETANDERSDTKFSGDASVLFHLIEAGSTEFDRANVYFAVKSNFKPAAPNLTEAEDAEILKPEGTHSVEGGLKARALNHQLSIDFSLFHMNFKNLVVSVLNPDGEPQLVNAGEERFNGAEVDLEYHPAAYENLSFYAGYARHDATYVHFGFIDPEDPTNFIDVSGNNLELVPKNLFNARVLYAPKDGLGGFVGLRFQGERPLNRDNTNVTESFTEWDAGVSYTLSRLRVSFVGRNLGDNRHIVTDSEIGDGQFYIAPPRRFTIDAEWSF